MIQAATLSLPGHQHGVDKLTFINDLISTMAFLRSQIGIVCALAFLFMAGGQAVHACADWSCDSEPASSAHSSCPDSQSCPAGQCCHAHSFVHLAMADHSDFFFMAGPSHSFAARSEIWADGPSREIDHPPQLV